jgi:hypothetical protein
LVRFPHLTLSSELNWIFQKTVRNRFLVENLCSHLFPLVLYLCSLLLSFHWSTFCYDVCNLLGCSPVYGA